MVKRKLAHCSPLDGPSPHELRQILNDVAAWLVTGAWEGHNDDDGAQ